MHLLPRVLHVLEMPLRVQRHPVQVVIIQGQAAQRCAGGVGQLLDGAGVERAQHGLAVLVHARLAPGLAQHAAIRRPGGQNQYLEVGRFGQLLHLRQLAGVRAVCHQQHRAARLRGFQYRGGHVDCPGGVLARRDDQLGG